MRKFQGVSFQSWRVQERVTSLARVRWPKKRESVRRSRSEGRMVDRRRGSRRRARRLRTLLLLMSWMLLKNQKRSGVAAKRMKVGLLNVPRAQTRPRGRRVGQSGEGGRGREDEEAKSRSRRERSSSSRVLERERVLKIRLMLELARSSRTGRAGSLSSLVSMEQEIYRN